MHVYEVLKWIKSRPSYATSKLQYLILFIFFQQLFILFYLQSMLI